MQTLSWRIATCEGCFRAALFVSAIIASVTHGRRIESEYQFHRDQREVQTMGMEARLGLILAFSLVLLLLAYAAVFPIIDAAMSALLMVPHN